MSQPPPYQHPGYYPPARPRQTNGMAIAALITAFLFSPAGIVLGIVIAWSDVMSRALMPFLVFVNMGVLAALAGLVFTGRLNSAGPGAGNLFELDAIAAAFIGGAAVTGGVGTIIGAITGGLIMGVLNNGMSLMGVGIDYQQFIKGMVLLLAVAFDVFNKRRAGART